MPIPLVGAMLGSAAIGAAGSWFSGKQSSDAAEDQYKHRYQWQMQDMKKAGLNPMLAISNAPPNVPQPSFENIGEGAIKGYSAAQQVRLAKAQEDATRATENKTLTEAKEKEMQNLMTETSPQFRAAAKAKQDMSEGRGTGISETSAKSWELETTGKQAVIDTAKKQMERTDLDMKLMNQSYDWNRDIQPLLRKEQEYINRAKEAGLSELEAAAEFWDAVGMGGKALETILDIIPGGEAISRMLMKKKHVIGKTTVTRRGPGGTVTDQSYSYGE